MINVKVLATFLLLTSTPVVIGLAENNASSVARRELEIFSGFEVALYDQELRIKLDLEKMLTTNAIQSGRHDHGSSDKKPNGMMSGFGSMIVMIPLIVQMLSVPGAIASIKMSLLKSLMVAKLALLVMLFNMLKNQQQPTEVVVIHQAPSQHHDHFYPHSHREDYEDDDKGWFG